MKKSIASFVFLVGVISGIGPAYADDSCLVANNDLQNCDFSNRDFFNYDLSGRNMSGVNLTSAYSRFAYWNGTNLSGANLTSANFYYTEMIGSNFTGANLTNSILTNVNLNNAILTDAVLTGVVSGSVKGTPAALPVGWKVAGGYLVGPGANLAHADLSGTDLTGVDLRGADLTGLRSGSVTGTPQLPADWQLLGGYLIGPGANLSYSNLDGIAIWSADFTGINLTGASVNGTGFIYPKSFEGTKSGGMVGTFQYGPRLINGYIIAPKVNLEGANLQGANLSNIDMTGANLRGADLTGASLEGATLADCNLVNADLTETNLSSANLRGCTIRNARFNDATLWETKLGYNEIVSSEFYGAKFRNTEFLYSELIDTRSAGITGSYLSDGNFEVLDGVIYNSFSESFSPTINGEVITGNTITASVGVIPPVLSTYNYQWLRDGVEISGADAALYVVQQQDFGKKLTLRLTVNKPGYLSRTDVSPEVSVAAKAMGLGVVRIIGKAKVGVNLKVQAGSWAPGAKSTYQWLRNGKAIKGATKSSYKAVAADKGKKIAVKVTQQSAGYLKSTRMSSSITIR